MKPRVAIVQGDAAGIGPELLAKLLSLDEVRETADIVVIGDRRVFDAGCAVAGQTPEVKVITDISDIEPNPGLPLVLDIASLDPVEIAPATVSGHTGRAVLQWLGIALDLAKDGVVDGVCFMPFNKQSMGKGGLIQEDETQWARDHLGHKGRVSEFNVVDGMWNGRVTSHIPLRDVAETLTSQLILDSIVLADRTLKSAGIARPRIAVAALNPHAGDGGKLGMEEIEIIRPAVEMARDRQIAAVGPLPSDTLYLRVRDGEFDCAMTMYHDQGQIAIKLLGFDRGVSVLAGLPVPLTTPAHGTAFDIVGKNVAKVEPARRAFMMVAEMATRRRRAAKGKDSAAP